MKRKFEASLIILGRATLCDKIRLNNYQLCFWMSVIPISFMFEMSLTKKCFKSQFIKINEKSTTRKYQSILLIFRHINTYIISIESPRVFILSQHHTGRHISMCPTDLNTQAMSYKLVCGLIISIINNTIFIQMYSKL